MHANRGKHEEEQQPTFGKGSNERAREQQPTFGKVSNEKEAPWRSHKKKKRKNIWKRKH